MPKYTFHCATCGCDKQTVTSVSVRDITCPNCQARATRILPTLNGPSSVTEVADEYTGIVRRVYQQEEVKQRRDKYYWSVEVPRFVQSGTYTVETMLENSWIYFDDKDHMHIRTKPPHID